ncbi:MAG: fructofuranosidase/invertase [Sinomicrobium sp.]|nr:fructofuranosidase/invertase [Sinomicrobium sp.]
MDTSFRRLYNDALALLRQLTTPYGILASALEADNYKKIWARDGVICGIAGLLAEDETLMEGLKNTLITLAENQHSSGMIPSNVAPDKNDVSYGSLAGRVDANTWFMVGACLYMLHTGDSKTWQALLPALQKCRSFLKTIEFNGKGWIYTPLSGNWADEYPVHGYTLYDNVLRIWGESLWNKMQGEADEQLRQLKEKTLTNFWPREDVPQHLVYHEPAFKEALKASVPHFLAFILPGAYDTRFDAAGNALALLHFQLTPDRKTSLLNFLDTLKHSVPGTLLPAFWPVVREGDRDWELMKNNYAFGFKNRPYHFHNGGIWPVWTGLFCLGLAASDLREALTAVVDSLTAVIPENGTWDFPEYLAADTLRAAGKSQMGFTASGIVFMYKAFQNKDDIRQKLGL